MTSVPPRKTPDVTLVRQGDPKSVAEIETYLTTFGYLARDGTPGTHDFKKALSNFQRTSHIPVTGEYDPATAAEMAKPRCAVQAPAHLLAAAKISGSVLATWPNLNLKYSFDNYTPKMKNEGILACMANVLQQWSACSGLKFTKVDSGGDIRFAWKGSEHGGADGFDGAGGTLATAWYPRDGRVHFDNAEGWDVGLLTGVALHEVGHALGLDHSDTKDVVMNAYYTGRQTLALEDKLRIGAAYGPYAPMLESNKGLGGYDLTSESDDGFAYDWHQNGRADHICFYRPGKGLFWIVGADHSGNWRSVYTSTNGLGGFDLTDGNDNAFAFDYYATGKNTSICLYRPGTGAIFIVDRDAQGNWNTVYKQTPGAGNGIGGFDMKDRADRAFALDYKNMGTLNHICLYRPGQGACFIVGRSGTGPEWPFVNVYGTPNQGIGGYDLTDGRDRAFAFDYNGRGIMNHICLYRPGKNAFFIIGRGPDTIWRPVYDSRPGGPGIGGFDLDDSSDRAIVVDGKNLFLWRPGKGAAFVVTNNNGVFTPFYRQGQDGSGIGGYDLSSGADRAFALSMNIDNKIVPDQLVVYRAGKGNIEILKKV